MLEARQDSDPEEAMEAQEINMRAELEAQPSLPQLRQIQNYRCEYERGQVIGKGAFGTVYQAKIKQSNQECAMKFIAKARLGKKNQTTFWELQHQELNVLQELPPHPHITRVLDLMENGINFVIVSELVAHGCLHTRLNA